MGGYIALLLSTQLPFFQKQWSRSIAATLSEKIGTKVTIKKTEIGLFNRIILHDVCIKDKNGATLLSANRLAAKIKIRSIVSPPLTIRTIELYGAEISLYKDTKNQPYNFNFIIDSLSSGNNNDKTPLNLRIKSIILGKTSIRHDIKSEQPHSGFDINHLRLENLDASINLQIINGDSFKLRVRNLAFKEKSGFRLKHSYAVCDIGKGQCNIPVLELETAHSRINLKDFSFSLANRKISRGKGFVNNTRINLLDANAFMPKLNLPDKFFYISSSLRISDNAILSDNLHITNGSGTKLVASVRYKSPTDFFADIKELKLPQKETMFWADFLPSDSTVHRYIRNTGDISFHGNSLGTAKTSMGINIRGVLTTQVGRIACSALLNTKGDFRAKAATDSLSLGMLLSHREKLGNIAFNLKCEKSGNKIKAKANIRQIEVSGYNYRNSALDLAAASGSLTCSLALNDSNIKSKIHGRIDKAGAKKHIVMKCVVEGMNPNALKITSKQEGVVANFQANADILGSNVDDAIGNIVVNDVSIKTPDSILKINEVALKAIPISPGRRININGDLGTAEIAGYLNINTLATEAMDIIRSEKATPTRISHDKTRHEERTTRGKHNNFNFYVKIQNPELLNKLLGLDIKFSGENYLIGYLDYKRDNLLIEGRLPKLQWKNQEFSDLNIYCKGDGSSLRSNIHFAKMLKSGKANIEVEAHRSTDTISCNLMWKADGAKEYSGDIVQNITFPNEDASIMNIEIAPSTIVIEDSVWQISPSLLVYSDGRLNISGFSMKHSDKRLTLNGAISKEKSDSLVLNLSGIRIRDITDMVAFDDVEFDGIATGMIKVSDLLSTPAINASLKVGDFKFNGSSMGNMELEGIWNNELKQMDLAAYIKEQNGRTEVKGYINTALSIIDLHFNANNTTAMFLNKFLPDAIRLRQGRTTGKLRLHGKLNAMNLLGSQTLSNVIIDVAPLGTTYKLDGDAIDFYNDTISFKNFGLTDSHDHHAELNGKVTHRDLHDFRYDFNIATNDFLVYNRQREHDVSFWGTAYGTGNVHITGFTGKLYVDAAMTPTANTVFIYNADQPSNPEDTQLITYSNDDDEADETVRSDDNIAETMEAVKLENKKATDILLNFMFNITPVAEIKVIMNEEAENTISVHGSGNLHAQYYNKGNFEMFGNYTIRNGTYKMTLQDLIHKDFHFRDGGTITFNGDPFAGDLNLKAVYTVPSVSLSDLMANGNLRDNSVKVDCIMNFTGSVGRPIVKFDLDMPSISADKQQMVRSLIATPEDLNMQIVYLLSFGRFYTYDYASQNLSASQSQSALAMNSFLSNTLSSNLNSFLSNVMNESKWTFGTNFATGNDGWNDMDVEGMFTGYLLNNRLILNGNLGYRDRNAYNTNFVGDFSVVYLLNPSGTIQLKAYSESNDRYFTKSTLTTQGGGIIFKRDFTKLKDIFKRKEKE